MMNAKKKKKKKGSACAGASWGTLLKRVGYGGRKGASASRRCAEILRQGQDLQKALA